MKKILAVVLVMLSIACLFCGCGNIKFNSDEEMYAYMKGIWEYDYGKYLIFDDQNIYDCYYEKHKEFFDDAFRGAWVEGGENSFNALTYEKVIENVSLDSIAQKFDRVTNSAEKGAIQIGEDPEYAGIIQIKKDCVEYKEEYADDFSTITKVSDDINFDIEYLKENFKRQKDRYMLPVKEFIPTLDEYAQRIKKVYPDISQWPLAHEASTSTIYTDTGSTTNYQNSLLINQNVVMLSKNKKLSVTYNSKADSDMPSLFVEDKTGLYLNDIFALVNVFLEDYPKALNMNEFQNQFEENSKVSNGQKIYETTVDGIKYKIQRSNSAGTTMVWIFL